jgi:nucleoside 2-deoxyribosyltransferase
MPARTEAFLRNNRYGMCVIGIAVLCLFTPLFTGCVKKNKTPAAKEGVEQPSVYLAGPLGFSEAGRGFQKGTLIPLITNSGCQVLDPWQLTDLSKIAAVEAMPYGPVRRHAWRSLDPEIAKNNRDAIDRAQAVLAVLDGTDVDSGTAAEIGYAFARGKVIIGYRGDFRLSSDNEGSTVNLQVEYFIKQSGGTIVDSIGRVAPELQARVHCFPKPNP